MWMVVYIAPDSGTAKKIKEKLTQESLLVKVRAIHKKSCKKGYYEVMVPESEAEEAQRILYNMSI